MYKNNKFLHAIFFSENKCLFNMKAIMQQKIEEQKNITKKNSFYLAALQKIVIILF